MKCGHCRDGRADRQDVDGPENHGWVIAYPCGRSMPTLQKYRNNGRPALSVFCRDGVQGGGGNPLKGVPIAFRAALTTIRWS